MIDKRLFSNRICRVCEIVLVMIGECEGTPVMATDLSIGGKRSQKFLGKLLKLSSRVWGMTYQTTMWRRSFQGVALVAVGPGF